MNQIMDSIARGTRRLSLMNAKKKDCGCSWDQCCSDCVDDITKKIKKAVITSQDTKKR